MPNRKKRATVFVLTSYHQDPEECGMKKFPFKLHLNTKKYVFVNGILTNI